MVKSSLRIICGEWSGRKLKVELGPRLRPTSDRARQAIWNILGQTADEAVVVDAFAGTGAFGFEALSLAAKKVYWIESDRKACKIIEGNRRLLEVQSRSAVLSMNVENAASQLRQERVSADIIFADPPYDRGISEFEARLLLQVLSPEGVFIIEQRSKDADHEIPGASLVQARTYGEAKFCFYRHL